MEKINKIVKEDKNILNFKITTHEGYNGRIWLKCEICNVEDEDVLSILKNLGCKCLLNIEEIIGFEINEKYCTIIFNMGE